MCLLLDAHFTVMVMLPEAKELLSNLHKFVRAQVSCIYFSIIISFLYGFRILVLRMEEGGGVQTTTNYIVN